MEIISSVHVLPGYSQYLPNGDRQLMFILFHMNSVITDGIRLARWILETPLMLNQAR
ncbi:hypothetical protein WN55_10654 [Dufourea novaeangliae]|uniref:Uncharacterized protein n=1 Tax=Dufourea novaeangliae TaxID=178035 RepID=A0A154P968_DUFNO|nr:hypothetical protein WN55_10654 [Dufourea novaeangliae]